jgi:hypothetical protein
MEVKTREIEDEEDKFMDAKMKRIAERKKKWRPHVRNTNIPSHLHIHNPCQPKLYIFV